MMTNAKFWYLPLKDVAPEAERVQLALSDEVKATDLPSSYSVPAKLFHQGIRAGHVLALHDGEKVVALARVLALDAAGSLHWRRLPLLTTANPIATPELSEVEPFEQNQFSVGIDALLRDVPASSGVLEPASAKVYSSSPSASNIILYGPPGTGKTHSVRRRAIELLGDASAADATVGEIQAEWVRLVSEGQIVFCTFHQAFAYEEFVEGLRALTDDTGNIHYEVEPGIFKALAAKAKDDPTSTYVLVIDEINRANIARVLGELITLLEPDKRLGAPNELRVRLPSSGDLFGVPRNLHVLGTMNTADRSIALMDVALRRRFTFEEMMPDSLVIETSLSKANVPEALRKLVVDVFIKLNDRLRYLYDREHQIGHAYFLDVHSLQGLRDVFADRILPLLQEYFFGSWDKIALVLGYPFNSDGTPKSREADYAKGTVLVLANVETKSVLGFDHADYDDQIAWHVHPTFRPRGLSDSKTWLAEAFLEILGTADLSVAGADLIQQLELAEEISET